MKRHFQTSRCIIKDIASTSISDRCSLCLTFILIDQLTEYLSRDKAGYPRSVKSQLILPCISFKTGKYKNLFKLSQQNGKLSNNIIYSETLKTHSFPL